MNDQAQVSVADSQIQRVKVIDSHTAGEPTRVVIAGGPELGGGPLAARVERFKSAHDDFRSAVMNEPRGFEAMVGALLCEPVDPTCATGVVFFNNVGYLGMCGHGTIGVIATLAYLRRIGPGLHRVETPVGVVEALLAENGEVAVANVPSYRLAANVTVDVPGLGPITGDVAWGGNWFFLVGDHGQQLTFENLEALTDYAWRVRQALGRAGITGADGREIDHIELYAEAPHNGADARNFVLCPGKAYDRSPCGTGTSAKMACLYVDGKLKAGQVWRQESIIGSLFEGTVAENNGKIHPTIKGRAFITAEADLIFNEQDPFRTGIRA